MAVIKRMEELEALGTKHVKATVVKEFPEVFTGVYASDIEKARYWWSQRERYLQGSLKTISALTASGRTRVNLKVTAGRGRKREDWVVWLHARVISEFLRLRAMGIKIGYPLLQDIARDQLENSTSKWKASTVIGAKKLVDRVTTRWVQTMCERYGIVPRCVSGKLAVSEEKQNSIERAVAYHLGQVKRDFDSGVLDDDLTANMDETHFIVNMDDGKTLDFCGASRVKYHDVVSGGEGMTLVVTLRGGKHACLETPMLIFTNAKGSYPIRGVSPIPGIVYRSGPKGWMDRRVFCEWLKNDQCVRRDPHGRQKVIFMDNVAGHKALETMEDPVLRQRMHDVLERKNVSVRFLPANSTHLCQPADLMIIQKLKQVWRQEWEAAKRRLAMNRNFSNLPNEAGEWSGKLNQPGKSFFLELAAQCVMKVSTMRDEDGMNIVRKAMIRCGLNKNTSGKWEESQLFPELQGIISKHREFFDGKEPEDFCEAIV